MECVNLKEEMDKAKRKIDLFGTDNFRSWLLYFVPGDGTDMHYHANPETFLVFSGNGIVKGLKGEERPIKKDDVLCLAAKDYYQIVNTGSEELRYLAVSTKLSPDIAEYPTTGKFGVLAEFPVGADGKPRGFRFVGRESDSLNYWEGE